MKKRVAPAVEYGGGQFIRGDLSAAIIAALVFAIALPSALDALDLVAVTESGSTILISEVEEDVQSLTITFRGLGMRMSDPVAEIIGLSELTSLRELIFYHVPQLVSFHFLDECVSIERLIITHARVKNIRFLESLQNLQLLHLEISGDWESESGLPFLDEPLDLSANSRLEYLAFRLCDLQRIPYIVHVPETLRIVDISYNAIEIDQSDIPALEALRQVEGIYINGNTIGQPILDSYNNIVLESSDTLLSRYLYE